MSATIKTVLSELNRVKQCGRAMLYIYLRDLRIKPLGAKQRPQLYPADTANRILNHLGIGNDVASLAPGDTKAARRDTRAALVSLPELRKQLASAKRKARR